MGNATIRFGRGRNELGSNCDISNGVECNYGTENGATRHATVRILPVWDRTTDKPGVVECMCRHGVQFSSITVETTYNNIFAPTSTIRVRGMDSSGPFGEECFLDSQSMSNYEVLPKQVIAVCNILLAVTHNACRDLQRMTVNVACEIEQHLPRPECLVTKQEYLFIPELR